MEFVFDEEEGMVVLMEDKVVLGGGDVDGGGNSDYIGRRGHVLRK